MFKNGNTMDEIVMEVYSLHNRIKIQEIDKMNKKFLMKVKSGYRDFIWEKITEKKKSNIQGNWRGIEDRFFNKVRKGFIKLLKPAK